MVVFPFPPDARGDIVETLAWQTDVLRSTSGAEQRRALRLAPRRTQGAGFAWRHPQLPSALAQLLRKS